MPIPKENRGISYEQFAKEGIYVVNKHRKKCCSHISKMQIFQILLRTHSSHTILTRVKSATLSVVKLWRTT